MPNVGVAVVEMDGVKIAIASALALGDFAVSTPLFSGNNFLLSVFLFTVGFKSLSLGSLESASNSCGFTSLARSPGMGSTLSE